MRFGSASATDLTGWRALASHMPHRASDDTRISCVIPCLNEASVIVACLEQFKHLPGKWEVIVADSDSTDGTREIAAAYDGVTIVDAPRGRGVGMNAGATRATSELLLFLHADTILPDDAWQLIITALADKRTSATAFRLRLDRKEPMYKLVEVASHIRILLQRTFFGDQAIAVRRRDFQSLGGFREVPLMEDVDLSRRLRRIGRLTVLSAQVTTSARRFERHGVIRTLLLMTGRQVAYGLGVPAERLARWYAAVR